MFENFKTKLESQVELQNTVKKLIADDQEQRAIEQEEIYDQIRKLRNKSVDIGNEGAKFAEQIRSKYSASISTLKDEIKHMSVLAELKVISLNDPKPNIIEITPTSSSNTYIEWLGDIEANQGYKVEAFIISNQKPSKKYDLVYVVSHIFYLNENYNYIYNSLTLNNKYSSSILRVHEKHRYETIVIKSFESKKDLHKYFEKNKTKIANEILTKIRELSDLYQYAINHVTLEDVKSISLYICFSCGTVITEYNKNNYSLQNNICSCGKEYGFISTTK